MTRTLLGLASLLSLLASLPAAAAGASITLDDGSQRWTLRNPYVERTVELTPSGFFRTLHFRALPRGRDWSTSMAASPEFRLVVRRADETPVELTGASGWSLLDQESGTDADGSAWLALTLDAHDWPLTVTVRYRCYPQSTVVQSSLTVQNTSRKLQLTLLAADSFNLRAALGSSPSLLWVRNFTWQQPDVALTPEEERLRPADERRLLTGPYGSAAAWMALRRSSSSGDAGLFAGWEWSGSGELSARLDAAPGSYLTLRAGLAAGTFAHSLAPGEMFTAPAGFVGIYSGSWDAAGEATRSFVDRYLSLPAPFEGFPLAAFNTWGYGTEIDQALVHRLVDQAADLGLELFTLDAGWMATLGDFNARPGAFDDGIAAIADHVHARGMRFGLWMALGSADASAPILRSRPWWRASVGRRPLIADFEGHAICLASAAAREAILAEADRVIESYHVDWLVHDFQVITRCDDRRHGHQEGDGDWASTAGYYELLDAIRQRHPRLILSNCWDGGNMLDFGMTARHHTTNLNDGNDAFGNRRAVFGASYFLPPRYIEKYVGDDGTPAAYRFKSGLPGGTLHVMGRLTEWDEETRTAAREAVSLFKSARGLLSGASVLHLTPPPQAGQWDALLHYDAASGRGVVSAFRGPDAPPEMLLKVGGLEPDSSFSIALHDGDEATSLSSKTGEELAKDGLLLSLPETHDGAILLVTRDE